MAIPVYLWLKDDDGNDIKGSVDVLNREGSIILGPSTRNRILNSHDTVLEVVE